MNIFIFTFKSPSDFSAPLIKKEFLKRGVNSKIFYYSQLSPKFNQKVLTKNKIFFILRCAEQYPASSVIKKYFKGKILINQKHILRANFWQNKFNQGRLFQKYHLKTPDIQLISKSSLKKIKYPIVIKKKISSRGREAFLIKNQSQLNQLISKIKPSDYFIQEYIPVKQDIRILILDNEILGAVNRTVRLKTKTKGQEFGVKVDKIVSVPKDISKDVLKIVHKFQCQFCGIDVIINKKNQYYFLEINYSSQFNAFEEKSGLNIAQKVADFAIRKVNNAA